MLSDKNFARRFCLLLVTILLCSGVGAQQPATLELNMPSNVGTKTVPKFPERYTITLILAKGNMVYYYNGLHYRLLATKRVPIKQIHGLLLQKQKEVAALSGKSAHSKHQLHVIIKASENSTYSNLVDILDEMTTNNIEKYAIIDITDEENKL